MCKMCQTAVLGLLDSPKSISRKIRVTEKLCNFHTVYLYCLDIIYLNIQSLFQTGKLLMKPLKNKWHANHICSGSVITRGDTLATLNQPLWLQLTSDKRPLRPLVRLEPRISWKKRPRLLGPLPSLVAHIPPVVNLYNPLWVKEWQKIMWNWGLKYVFIILCSRLQKLVAHPKEIVQSRAPLVNLSPPPTYHPQVLVIVNIQDKCQIRRFT